MARIDAALLAVAAVAWADPASAQGRLGGGGELNLSLTRILLSLLLCLAIAGLAALLIRRSGGRLNLSALRNRLKPAFTRKRRIDVIESRRLSVQADLCLVRCDDREYLILCGPQQQSVLREELVAADEPQ